MLFDNYRTELYAMMVKLCSWGIKQNTFVIIDLCYKWVTLYFYMPV